tara:strand:- start:895 stop:1086 length:192 start_codon:yes stop_codon:yes gene_type:complete
MKEFYKVILGWICITIAVLMAVLIFKLKFENPELTETQLFLRVKWFVLGLVISVLGYKECFKY